MKNWLFRFIDTITGKQAARQIEFDLLVAIVRAEELERQREFLRVLKRDIQGWDKP